MENNNSAGLQPSSNSSAIIPYPSSDYSSCPQNPNPTVAGSNSSMKTMTTHEYYNGVGIEARLSPSGVDSTALSSYISAHLSYDSQTAVSYGLVHPQALYTAASSLYYSDPNAYNVAVREAFRLVGSDPIASGQAGASVASDGSQNLIMTPQNLTFAPNTIAQTLGNGTQKKYPKKPKMKTKIVQSANCAICKVDCTSKEILDQHKLGKKHMKNLKKLKQATIDASLNAASGSSNPVVIGPQENPNKGKVVLEQKGRKKAAEPKEDLETKRRKVLNGGAAVQSIRTCSICNVVCNSQTVYNFHISGQKHTSMVLKYAAAAATAEAGAKVSTAG